MAHSHEHHHEHVHELTSLNKSFIIGITLNILFVLVEFGIGFYYDSLGLLSDAGHNLGDVASLVLAMLAFRLAKVHPNSRYTYGYKEKDLNVKGAYLHMAADTLVSVGVVISGIIIMYTGWTLVDPIIGLVIAVIIVISTWSLLHDSLRLSLDGVPLGIDSEKIGRVILEQPGVESYHHLHIWALSTTETALTAHIVIGDLRRMEEVKREVKHELEHVGITHATLEFEYKGACCEGEDCIS